MNKPTYRTIQYFLVVITLFMLFASFYFQYIVGLQPCPLCLMQRLCVFLLLLTMGLNLRTLKRAHVISFIQLLISGFGLFFSLRQLWLQSLPASQAPACMPGLDTLIHYFPWQTVAKALFWGSGDCAEATLSILGISMPAWSALYFLFMAIVGFFLFIRTRSGTN